MKRTVPTRRRAKTLVWQIGIFENRSFFQNNFLRPLLDQLEYINFEFRPHRRRNQLVALLQAFNKSSKGRSRSRRFLSKRRRQ
jgi:hypothetical protein